MTQNDKQLLLKDLCSRLPYGIFVYDEIDNKSIYTISYHPHIDNCKPYLRPMSSMTEKERNEITAFGIDEINESIVDFGEFICEGSPVEMSTVTNIIDYLNEHHFDYRGLIPMGLALEAPDGMYKTE